MQDQTRFTAKKAAKPQPTTKGTPATPVKPDPHAGHDMSKPMPQKPATPPKAAGKY